MSHRYARRSLFLTMALAVLPFAASLPAHAAVDLAAPVPVGPQVKVGTLPNGLTYYIQRNAKPANRLELRLVVKAGSVLEDEDQQGLAHFTEHMAFNGSTHFKKHELVDYLQRIGVKMGADVNAYTSFDETVYMLPVPTERPDNVDQAFTILEDWAHGVAFQDADIDKERDIVLEELRLGKGAGERLSKVLMPKLFNGSRYADRMAIGKEAVIRSFPYDTVRRFYRDWYRPDLMAVVAVGDIDPAEAERQIKAHFGGLANPAHERVRSYPGITARKNSEALVLQDDEITTGSVSINYPAAYAPDPGTYGSERDKIVERLFATMLNQRLSELAQQPTPPFMGAAIGISRLTPRYKSYVAGASLGAGGSAPAIAALVQEQQRVRQFGFTKPELERAVKTLQRGFERSYAERDTRTSSSFAAEYLRNFLANETLPGAEVEHRISLDFLSGIGLDEVNTFARATIPVDTGKLVVYVGPGKGAAAPAGPALLAETDAAAKLAVTAHEEKAVAAQLMARPATPGRIVEESGDKALGLTRLTLSNGVKVVLKPTTLKQDQVLLAARRYGGQTLFPEQDIANARYASSLASAMGLKDFTPTDLRKVLAGRNASVGVSLGSYTDDIGGASGSDAGEIETMLQLLWLRFDGVRRDDGLYRSYLGKQQELMRNRAADPNAAFRDRIVDTLYAHHPYEPREIVLGDLAKLDLDRSLAIYRQRFASAKGMTFFIVGAFDVAAIKPLVATYLGSLPTPDLPLAVHDVGLRTISGVHKEDVRAGSEPKSTISLTFSGPAHWSVEETTRMSTLMAVMNLRVFDVLREKLGLIYGGQMSGGVSRLPYEHYAISVTLPTGPEKVDQLVAAVYAEIARMKAEGPTQAELDKVKKNLRLSFERAKEENGFWLGLLQGADFDHLDPQRMLHVVDETDALTPDDIRKTAQRYFDTGNVVQVVLNPATTAVAAVAPKHD